MVTETDLFAPRSRDDAPWMELPAYAARTAAGYPVHRVVTYRVWVNPNRCPFVDWRAHCGAADTIGGGVPYASHVFGDVLHARRAELCRDCYPTKDWRRPAR